MAETAEFVLYPQVAPSFAGANQVPQRTVFMEEPTAEEFKNLQNEMRQIFLTGNRRRKERDGTPIPLGGWVSSTI
jgi:hypothetical protein